MKGHSALGAFQKHLFGLMDAALLVGRALLSQVLSQTGHCASLGAGVPLGVSLGCRSRVHGGCGRSAHTNGFQH